MEFREGVGERSERATERHRAACDGRRTSRDYSLRVWESRWKGMTEDSNRYNLYENILFINKSVLNVMRKTFMKEKVYYEDKLYRVLRCA